MRAELPDDDRWRNYVPDERAVILFVLHNGKILLIDKKRGFGKGKVNGPGGRIEPGETPEQAAVRETREEVGLEVSSPTKMALLRFIFKSGYHLEVIVFTTGTFTGTPVETDEARPFWRPLAEIPYDRMWADDSVWLPMVLRGERIFGQFVFDEDEMLESEISVLGAG